MSEARQGKTRQSKSEASQGKGEARQGKASMQMTALQVAKDRIRVLEVRVQSLQDEIEILNERIREFREVEASVKLGKSRKGQGQGKAGTKLKARSKKAKPKPKREGYAVLDRRIDLSNQPYWFLVGTYSTEAKAMKVADAQPGAWVWCGIVEEAEKMLENPNHDSNKPDGADETEDDDITNPYLDEEFC